MVTTLSNFENSPQFKYQASRLETLSVLTKLIRAETKILRLKKEIAYFTTKKNTSTPMGDLNRLSDLKTQLLAANAKMLGIKLKHLEAKFKEKELKSHIKTLPAKESTK